MERLIDPLIADLQHEYADALRRHGAWRSRWTLLSGYVTIAKAIGLHGCEQSRRALYAWAVADAGAGPRTLACAVAVTAVFTVLGQMAVMQDVWFSTTANRALLVIYAMPASVLTALPIGFTLGILYGLGERVIERRSTRAVLMVALVCSMASFAAAGWILPAANHAFRIAVAGNHVLKGVNELTLGELQQRVSDPASDRTALACRCGTRFLALALHTRAAFAFATLVLGFFALAARHISAAWAVIIAWAVMILAGQLILLLEFEHGSGVLHGSVFTFALLAMASALWRTARAWKLAPRWRTAVRLVLGLAVSLTYVGYYFWLLDDSRTHLAFLSPVAAAWLPNLIVASLALSWMTIAARLAPSSPVRSAPDRR